MLGGESANDSLVLKPKSLLQALGWWFSLEGYGIGKAWRQEAISIPQQNALGFRKSCSSMGWLKLRRTSHLIAMLLPLILLEQPGMGNAASPTFDEPVSKKRIELIPRSTDAANYKFVSCFYFKSFMVKEMKICGNKYCDGKEGDLAQLSLTPVSDITGRPACQLAPLPSEKHLAFTGHFVGAKEPYCFFDNPNEEIGGPIRFQVVDGRTAQKVFEEISWDGVFGDISLRKSGLHFRFKRAISPECAMDLPAPQCWEGIKTHLRLEFKGMKVHVPNCSDQLFSGHSLWVGYPAEGSFDGVNLTVKPLKGDIECSRTP